MIIIPVLVVAGGLAGWYFGQADGDPDVCKNGWVWECTDHADNGKDRAATPSRGEEPGGEDPGGEDPGGEDPDHCPKDKDNPNSGRGNGSEGDPDQDPGNSGGHNQGGD